MLLVSGKVMRINCQNNLLCNKSTVSNQNKSQIKHGTSQSFYFTLKVLSGSSEERKGSNYGVYAMDKMVMDEGPFVHSTPSGPYFDPEFTKNISVVTGGAAVLNCRVYNIGNRTVRKHFYIIIKCIHNAIFMINLLTFKTFLKENLLIQNFIPRSC